MYIYTMYMYMQRNRTLEGMVYGSSQQICGATGAASSRDCGAVSLSGRNGVQHRGFPGARGDGALHSHDGRLHISGSRGYTYHHRGVGGDLSACGRKGPLRFHDAAIVGSTLAASAGAVRASGPALMGAVAGLHASGFFLGYVISKALGLSDKICRTMSIEVGMQNSTLGAVLAALHFSDPLTAAPCAVSACTHSVMGSALAAFWQRTTSAEAEAEAELQTVTKTEASDTL
ncbi:hypothetical protein Vafri_2459 [Volvox africanus]|uniref:Uncharacterized protein n=1 Tax=Volvox africanus TaxID=51714 RepID=A0A8J4AQG5_9CHLO|nr:hypothetical protein Vafri_2459 [Volvox africanus]